LLRWLLSKLHDLAVGSHLISILFSQSMLLLLLLLLLLLQVLHWLL
jgi:hypothetical protein